VSRQNNAMNNMQWDRQMAVRCPTSNATVNRQCERFGTIGMTDGMSELLITSLSPKTEHRAMPLYLSSALHARHLEPQGALVATCGSWSVGFRFYHSARGTLGFYSVASSIS
jgi:hypothetical protein